MKTTFTPIIDPFLEKKQIELTVLRDDLNNPDLQGNKYWKLKYNLANASKKGNQTLLTFGGAYSNHILAVAKAGKKYGFNTIGILRGEETLPLNYTLSQAKELGMQLHYINRSLYRLKNTLDFKENLRNEYGSFYLIPEGGSNYYAVNGCMEIITDFDSYDYICCPIGTGGTIAGITIANQNKAKIIGFPALKGGDFLMEEVKNFMQLVTNEASLTSELISSLSLQTAYHFGGYAKFNEELINFVRKFYATHQIKWDLIYNGKMAFGVYDLIQKDFFQKGTKILLLHTGGIQGINGMEERNKIRIYE